MPNRFGPSKIDESHPFAAQLLSASEERIGSDPGTITFPQLGEPGPIRIGFTGGEPLKPFDPDVLSSSGLPVRALTLKPIVEPTGKEPTFFPSTATNPAPMPSTMPRLRSALGALSGNSMQATNFFSGGLDPDPNDPIGQLLNLSRPSNRSSFGLFFESMISAGTKELFGSRPNTDIERYRSESPVGGVLSWLAGTAPFFIIPGTAVARGLAAGLPGITRAMMAAERLKNANHLFRAGVVREATIFAPFEAARVAGSLVNPEEGSTARAAASAATELALFGGIGGTFAALGPKLKAFKPERTRNVNSASDEAAEFRVAKHVGEKFDRKAPDQVKWEFLTEYKKTQDAASPIIKEVDDLVALYSNRIKIQEPPQNLIKNGTRYVAFLGTKAKTARVESLYKGGLAGGPKAILSRIMNVSKNGFATIEEATRSLEGFEELAAVEGIKDTYKAITQFQRELIATSPKAKERLIKILQEDFTQVGTNEWLTREASDGLYIGIKRQPGFAAGEVAGTQIERAKQMLDPFSGRFYIFKTNSPSKWFKSQSGVSETNASLYKELLVKRYRVEVVQDSTVPILNLVENMGTISGGAQQTLFAGKTRWSTEPNVSAEVGRLRLYIEKFLPEDVKAAAQEPLNAVGEAANALRIQFAPGRLQGGPNPRLAQMTMDVKAVFNAVAAMTNVHLLGPLKSSFMRTATGSPIGQIFRTAFNTASRREGGVLREIKTRLETSPEALDDFLRMRAEFMSVEQATELGLNSEAIAVKRLLDGHDAVRFTQMENQAKALGMDLTLIPKAGHMGLVNQWEGAFRAPIIEDATGIIRGYGSGFNKQAAADNAMEIINGVNEEAGVKLFRTLGTRTGSGVDLTIADNVIHSGSKDIQQGLAGNKQVQELVGKTGMPTDISNRQADLFGFAASIDLSNSLVKRIAEQRSKIIRTDPVRFKRTSRPGKLGGAFTGGKKQTVDDIMRTYAAGATEMDRYMAREALATGHIQEQFAILAKEDSGAAVTFSRIFNSFNGISGPVAKTIEVAVDSVLADTFGPGVASKIMRGANQAMFTLTLGSLDAGFAALNLITPAQTAWSEIAWLRNAPAEQIQKYYTPIPVRTADGGFRTVWFQDTWKLAKVAMGDVWRPDTAMRADFARAFDEHVIGREFVETVQGPLRGITEGSGGFWDNAQRISEFMVVSTEEASRTYSFALGRRFAMDFMNATPEEAFHFGRQFVNNTMFGYQAADRPRVLTGAIGAGWGLFKNWTFNYTGNLAKYTGAASRGNFEPLMWAGATTGAVGGLAAMPLAGMADSMARFAADKPLSDLVYDWVGNDPGDDTKPWTADLMMHGVFSLFGFSLRSRASVPSSHLATDLVMATNIAIFDRLSGAFEAAGVAIEDITDFRIPFENPQFRRKMLKAFAPRTLQRAMTSFGEKGVQSLNTGNTLLPALNLYDGLFRSLGLTPIRVLNAFEVHQESYKDVDSKRKAIQKLGRRWADAELNRDWQEVARITNEAAWDEGVPLPSVMKSAQARMRAQTETVTKRQFDEEVVRRRLQMRGLKP